MAKRGGFPGMGNMGNMQSLMKQAQKMQEEMQRAQQEAEAKEFEVSVGGGAVTVKMSGKKELLSITLEESVVDPEDIEMLQDLIISAINEAYRQAEESMSSAMGKLTGGLNIPGF
ncbi:YbaB/EbfC family nucleoid-associated protein [Guggenheimella bovis]